MLALRPTRIPVGRCDVPINEKWLGLRGCILARQAHRPIKGALTCTSLGYETMMPSLRASLNLTAVTQYSVAIIPEHREWFLATNGTHVGFVRP